MVVEGTPRDSSGNGLQQHRNCLLNKIGVSLNQFGVSNKTIRGVDSIRSERRQSQLTAPSDAVPHQVDLHDCEAIQKTQEERHVNANREALPKKKQFTYRKSDEFLHGRTASCPRVDNTDDAAYLF